MDFQLFNLRLLEECDTEAAAVLDFSYAGDSSLSNLFILKRLCCISGSGGSAPPSVYHILNIQLVVWDLGKMSLVHPSTEQTSLVSWGGCTSSDLSASLHLNICLGETTRYCVVSFSSFALTQPEHKHSIVTRERYTEPKEISSFDPAVVLQKHILPSFNLAIGCQMYWT